MRSEPRRKWKADMNLQEIQPLMLAVITLICGAGVPWAFIVERKIAKIEEKLNNGLSKRQDVLETSIHELTSSSRKIEIELARIAAHLQLDE